MKISIKSSICFAFLSLVFINTDSIAQKKPDLSNEVVICGNANSAKAIKLKVYPEIFITEDNYTSQQEIEPKNGQFIFRLKAGEYHVYINLTFIYKGKPAKLLQYFLVKGGDSVFISENDTNLSFSGKSGAKFQCQYDIKSLSPAKNGGDLQTVSDYYQLLKNWDRQVDSLYQEKIKILSKNKALFDKTTFDLLYTDCSNDQFIVYDAVIFDMYMLRSDSRKQQQFINYYLDFLQKKEIAIPSLYVAQHSATYCSCLLLKMRCDYILKQLNYKPGEFKTRPIDALYPEIISRFTGDLKELLLTVLFKGANVINDTLSSYITETISTVKSPVLKSVLINVQRKTRGALAYNFNLPDSSGQLHRLSDFKGKIVVVDFWYTGCVWCPVMANLIRPIAAQKDTNVVFITISVDQNKDRWKESLIAKRYTSDDEINLSTDGKGYDHPLLQFYDIHLYPALYIIDRQGRIATINPISTSLNPAEGKKLQRAIEAAYNN